MSSTSSSTAAVAAQQQQKFIPSIAEGLRLMQSAGQELRTMDFVELIDRIITVFDHLGPVLVFAKQDMHTKAESLRQAAPTHPALQDIVKADKAAGILTQKNSRARNLHRLTAVLHFMRLLLSKLLEAPTISVKEAATFAYQASLAPIHPYAVQTAVWAGMYLLPTRQGFLDSIGETEESARAPAAEFSSGAEQVEKLILALYDIPMPASDVAPTNMFAGWWGSPVAAAPAST